MLTSFALLRIVVSTAWAVTYRELEIRTLPHVDPVAAAGWVEFQTVDPHVLRAVFVGQYYSAHVGSLQIAWVMGMSDGGSISR